jgi:hypothetical protein
MEYPSWTIGDWVNGTAPFSTCEMLAPRPVKIRPLKFALSPVAASPQAFYGLQGAAPAKAANRQG